MLSDDNDVAPEFLDMAALKYSMYCKDAMSGACGKTAKFWMIYCHLVDLYLLFHGEMKSCDVDLFTIQSKHAIIGHNDTNILIMGLYYNNSSTFIDIKGTTDKLNLIQALLEYTTLLVAITLLHFSEKVKSIQLK